MAKKLSTRKRFLVLTLTSLIFGSILVAAWLNLSTKGFALFTLVGASIAGVADHLVNRKR